MIMITHYEYRLTPDATIAVEESGNVVLRTPERRITITTARGVFPYSYNPKTGRFKRELPTELRR